MLIDDEFMMELGRVLGIDAAELEKKFDKKFEENKKLEQNLSLS